MSISPLLDQDDSDSNPELLEEEEDLLLPRMAQKSKGLFDVKKSIYALTFLSAVGGMCSKFSGGAFCNS